MPYMLRVARITTTEDRVICRTCGGSFVEDSEGWVASHRWCSDYQEFTTRDDATQYQRNADGRYDESIVVYVPTSSDLYQWQYREQRRFDRGEYYPLPWQDCVEPFSDRYYELRGKETIVNETLHHHAHLSLRFPGQIAYTKTLEAGFSDSQVTMRPGRYLQAYYPGLLSDTAPEGSPRGTLSELSRFIAACVTRTQAPTMSITTDPAVIRRIHMTVMNGWGSCMQAKNPSQYDWQPAFQAGRIPCHPCEIYSGDGADLAIAYLGDIDHVKARAVVWPAKMTWYGTAYGDTAMMRAALEAAGYTTGSIDGARVRRVRADNGRIVMPYIDGVNHARADGAFCILGSGPLECSSTSGRADDRDEDEDEDEDTTGTCDHCSDRVEQSELDDNSGYCTSCNDDRMSCDRCGCNIWEGDDYTRLDDGDMTVCDDCIGRYTSSCVIADCHNTWVERALETNEQDDREAAHMADVCPSCFPLYTYCVACGDCYDVESLQCDCCSATPVSDDTADLPLDGAR